MASPEYRTISECAANLALVFQADLHTIAAELLSHSLIPNYDYGDFYKKDPSIIASEMVAHVRDKVQQNPVNFHKLIDILSSSSESKYEDFVKELQMRYRVLIDLQSIEAIGNHDQKMEEENPNITEVLLEIQKYISSHQMEAIWFLVGSIAPLGTEQMSTVAGIYQQIAIGPRSPEEHPVRQEKPLLIMTRILEIVGVNPQHFLKLQPLCDSQSFMVNFPQSFEYAEIVVEVCDHLNQKELEALNHLTANDRSIRTPIQLFNRMIRMGLLTLDDKGLDTLSAWLRDISREDLVQLVVGDMRQSLEDKYGAGQLRELSGPESSGQRVTVDKESALKYQQVNFRRQTKVSSFINTRVCEVTPGYIPNLGLKLGETWKERTLEEIEQLRATLLRQLPIQSDDELIKTYEIVEEDDNSIAVHFLIPINMRIQRQFDTLVEFLFAEHVLAVESDGYGLLDMEFYWQEYQNCLLSAVLIHDAELVSKVLQKFPAKELIGHFVNTLSKEDFNVPSMYISHSPLMIACGEGSHDVVKVLLANKASLEFQNEAGVNVIHVACQRGDIEMVALLVNHCDNYSHSVSPIISAATTKEGLTPLHYAAMHDSPDIVSLLLTTVCNVLAQDAEGNTALHVAYKMDSKENQDILSKFRDGILLQVKNKDGKLPSQMTSELVIPPEIERRGKEAVEKFKNFLKKGKMKVPCCNLLFLGEERVGKTSLYRRLTRQGFDPKEESTRGIHNLSVAVVEQQRVSVDRDNWKENIEVSCQQDENDKLVAQAAHDAIQPDVVTEATKLTKPEILKKLETISHDSYSILPMQETVHDPSQSQLACFPRVTLYDTVLQSPSHSISIGSDEQVIVTPFDLSVNEPVVVPITTSMPESSQSGEEQDQHVDHTSVKIAPKLSRQIGQMFLNRGNEETKLTLNVFDFAGQTEYYAMHNCFIMKEAMYVVAFNLVDMVKYLRNKGMSTNPVQRVRYWLLSIHSHIRKDDNECKQRVILVGTHKRSVSKRDLDRVHRMLESELCNDPRCVTYLRYIKISCSERQEEWRIFIAVENSLAKSSRSDDVVERSIYDADKEDGINSLRDELKQLSSQLKFLKEDRPITWLQFESKLMSYRIEIEKQKRESENQKKKTESLIVNIGTVKSLAKEQGITEEEQELMLQYLHDTGKIVLLGQKSVELADLVILDPKWLIKVMQAIVELDTSHSRGVPVHLIETLKTKGVATSTLLRKCWSDFYSDESSFLQLCSVFLAYNLIFAISGSDHQKKPGQNAHQEFLVPCKLPKKLMVDIESREQEDAEKLKDMEFYFDFQNFLPEQIFHQLVCKLVAASQSQTSTVQNYHLSSTCCQFLNISECFWRIEFLRDAHTLKMSVRDSRLNADKDRLCKYIERMHKEYLLDICRDSNLHGVEYVGGPMLYCFKCDRTEVLRFVRYASGREKTSLPECSNCLTRYNTDELIHLQRRDVLTTESAILKMEHQKPRDYFLPQESMESDLMPATRKGAPIYAADWWGLLKVEPELCPSNKNPGITIAILDTGVDVEHAGLKQKYEDGLIKGENFVAKEPDETHDHWKNQWYKDPRSHGTMAAFIAAGSSFEGQILDDDSDKLYNPSGVAQMANLYICRIANSKGKYLNSAFVSALKALEKRKEDGEGLDVVSMSFGVEHDSDDDDQIAAKRVIRRLVEDHKVICVAAVGNYGDHKPVLFPACLSDVIAVGTLNRHDKRHEINPGSGKIDVYAPGEGIMCPYVPKPECPDTDSERFTCIQLKDGSSCATPALAGLVALMLYCKKQHICDEDMKWYKKIFIPEDLKRKIFDDKMAMARHALKLDPPGFFKPLVEKYELRKRIEELERLLQEKEQNL